MITVLMILWGLAMILIIGFAIGLVSVQWGDYRRMRARLRSPVRPRSIDQVMADFLNHPDRYEEQEQDARYEP